jgi:hypothetical protein
MLTGDLRLIVDPQAGVNSMRGSSGDLCRIFEIRPFFEA